jgi:hypothetical protein
MPTETRIVTFSNDEIKQAIASYCVKTGRVSSNTGLAVLTFTNEGEVKAAFQPAAGAPMMTLTESELAAAVLLFCKQHAIPIARRSIKSLQVAKDVVSLCLTTPAREKSL